MGCGSSAAAHQNQRRREAVGGMDPSGILLTLGFQKPLF